MDTLNTIPRYGHTGGGGVDDGKVLRGFQWNCVAYIIRTVVRIVGMGRMSHICNTKCSRL